MARRGTVSARPPPAIPGARRSELEHLRAPGLLARPRVAYVSARVRSGVGGESHAPFTAASTPARDRPAAAARRARGAPPSGAGRRAPTGTAADGPGALSHFDLARKDCVGTARNRTSKVWFTVADGVLSDVYYPTNDTTENETLQYVVTDGATFTDLQTRDMTYTVTALDDRALTCRVTATAKSGRYRIVTDYLTDPGRPTVLLRSRFEASARPRLRLPRLRPLRPDAQRQRRRRRRPRQRPTAAPTAATSRARRPHAARRLRPRDRDERGQPRLRPAGVQRAGRLARVPAGVQRVRRACQRRPDPARREPSAHRHVRADGQGQPRADGARSTSTADGAFEIALGFGATANAAVGAARGTLRADSDALAAAYRRGWHRYDARARLPAPPGRRRAGRLGRAPRPVLPERQLREGGRGQDVPRRRRGRARVAVGAGDLRRRPGEHVLRLLPRDLRPRPLRGVDRPVPRRRPGDRARHDRVPVRAPAAAGRLDAAQQPDERQARAGHVQHPARRVLVPDRHGARGRAHRPHVLRGPHQAGGELRRSATGRRSARSAGRSRAASRRRRSPPRSRA